MEVSMELFMDKNSNIYYNCLCYGRTFSSLKEVEKVCIRPDNQIDMIQGIDYTNTNVNIRVMPPGSNSKNRKTINFL